MTAAADRGGKPRKRAVAFFAAARLAAALLAALFLADFTAPACAAPVCRGAGLAPEAAPHYLISVPWTYPENDLPTLPDGPSDRESGRMRIEDVAGKVDSVVFIIRATGKNEPAPHSDQEAVLFMETDINGDAFPDFMIYEPCGAFFHIRLYAGCGDTYFTPVGAFDSREIPEPRAALRPLPEPPESAESGGAGWAEYVVIAPDPTQSHYDPLVNWARRTWKFDGARYSLTAVEPVKKR